MLETTCILITSMFPFRTGEEFIETEIQYLSKTFDKIIIFPLFPNNSEKPTREVSNNVKYYPLGITSGKLKYPKYIVKGIFTKNNIATIPDIAANTFNKKLVSLYSKGRSNACLNQIVKQLPKINLKDSKILIYSYWFIDHSLTAINLKTHLNYINSNLNIKVISRAHGYDLYSYRNSLDFLPFRQNQLSNIDAVYPCSTDGVTYLQKKYPKYKNKIKVAFLGTEDMGLSIIPKSNIFNIVTCSSIIPLKRLNLLEKSLEIVKQKGFSFIWTCIGDGTELPKLKRTVLQSNICNDVKFKGSMNNNDVLTFYKNNSVSLFCNVSETEGLPVSIMEALSFGIPCIATNVGGTSDLINDTVGYLLPSNVTAEELAISIIKIIELNSQKYQELRSNARNKWEELSSADNNYKKWCKTLLTLLKEI